MTHPIDKDRQLADVLRTAEAFRVAMIESGAVNHVRQDRYIEQLRPLERALQPLNYVVPEEDTQRKNWSDLFDSKGCCRVFRDWCQSGAGNCSQNRRRLDRSSEDGFSHPRIERLLMMVSAAGFEPAVTGIKIRRLSQLGDAPVKRGT